MEALISTNFSFPNLQKVYNGKVRDVYFVEDLLIMVATDRISAFDVVLPKGIPFKGQILNEISTFFLDMTTDIVPNWKIESPDPMVTIGKKCEPFKVEMIVRGYLTGSAWRTYQKGFREICGIKLPEGLQENQKFENPLITPTTKAESGHDQDISKNEIISQGLVSKLHYEQLEKYALALFERGTQYAAQRGLILVDTKYEFGLLDNTIYLIDEVHTPDSSRYFYADDYQQRFEQGLAPRQLSKEFVRQWLMDNNFMGRQQDTMPQMTEDFVKSVSDRYIELYEIIMGKSFNKLLNNDKTLDKRIETAILKFLYNYQPQK